MVAKSEAIQTEHSELVQSELHTLRENLEETLTLVEDMKNQLRDCEESEARDQALVGETLMQLETAKQTVEALKSDGFKAMEAYDAISSKLNQSNARINILEELVSKLKADVSCVGGKDSQDEGDCKTELTSLKLEVERLQSALEAAETRYNEEQARNAEEMRNAYELVEQMKSTTSQREAGMESEVQKAKEKIEELKANLMDKETELQCICEENEGLMMRLENTLLDQRECEQEMGLQRSNADVEELRKNLMDKETELQNLSEENETLRMRIKDNNWSKTSDDELEIARAAEKEALKKVNYMAEEVNKSNGRAARAAEQLEAAQASNAEMETEFRRLKVQCNQWRKAAETAAAMLSTGNNLKVMERTGSLDSNYSPGTGNISSPFAENVDEDLIKKKNTNMLRRIGVMWKKPQK
ncbi:Interactor of constitutive active ROPs 3 [Forsythia ovata]|uniref:Interactor of constitutive active ROPs 3 n=1 Tax=Forsythia ovata TaxID=205694 RepID=A0ABD1T748_9LAMI